MQAERPVDTVGRWIFEDWVINDVDKEELITKLHSISNETNRVPDTRYYEYKNGLLIDPDTKDPILKHIAQGVEYGVAEELQARVAASEEGVFIWNSPKLAGVYPCNKTMIYQIAYNESLEKVLLYSAILYDGEIENPEEHRKTLVSAEDSNETLYGVLSWIEKVSQNKAETASGHSRQTAAYFAEQIKGGVDPRVVMAEMQASGFIGQHSISCPGSPSFSDYTTSRANILIYAGQEDNYGALQFECDKCHQTNTRPYGKLIAKCQHCGGDVSCGKAA